MLQEWNHPASSYLINQDPPPPWKDNKHTSWFDSPFETPWDIDTGETSGQHIHNRPNFALAILHTAITDNIGIPNDHGMDHL